MSLISRIRAAASALTTKDAPPSTVGGSGSWNYLTGGVGVSSSGLVNTTVNTLAVPAAYAAIRAISEDIAKMPLLIQRRGPDGTWVTDERHPLNALFDRPNAWHSRFDVMSIWVAGMVTRGNGYAYVPRDMTGSPCGFIPVGPDFTVVNVNQSNGRHSYAMTHALISGAGGTILDISPENVAHIRNFNIGGGILGLSPIAVAADALSNAYAVQQHSNNVFGHGAGIGGILSTENVLTPEAAKRIGEDWVRSFGGVGNSGKTAVLEAGMKFSRIPFDANEAQWIETRTHNVIDVARIFRIPPHKLADHSEAHYANIVSENESYVLDTLTPICIRIEQELARVMFFEAERGLYRFKFDTDMLTRSDIKTRYEVYRTASELGVLNRNEIRAMEGRAPIPGGDVYRVSLNSGEADTDNDGVSEGDESTTPATETPDQ